MVEEAKARIAETIREAFLQYTEGCGRSVCFNKDCFLFPFETKVGKNLAAVHILNCFNTKSDQPYVFRFCKKLPNSSEAASSEAKSIEEIFSHLDVMGGMFLKGKVTEEDPAIDYEELAALYHKAKGLVEAQKLPKYWLLQCLVRIEEPTNYSQLFLPRALLVLLEFPDLLEPEMIDTLFQIAHLAIKHYNVSHVRLENWLRGYSGVHLLRFIQSLQQSITVRICDKKNSFASEVITAVQLLDIMHKANQPGEQVSYKEFYNDAVNQETDMQKHFINWFDAPEAEPMHDPETFSLMFFPWILDSATKSELLRYESILQQRQSQRQNIRDMVQLGTVDDFIPYCLLEVHRDTLIQDTMLKLVHSEYSLKMPLKVHFINEEGIDGGGVQKEFFQLIVRELFSPDYGMFSYYEDTRLYWFNPDSMATDDDFELVGTILGLAIYNSNIIDVHLPLAVYKKLTGENTGIDDIAVFDPVLAKSLKEILKIDGDVREILCRNFDVETRPYGDPVIHELKPGGAQIPVSNSNRAEYVSLYVDWVLNKSTGSHFESFRNGFLKVCGGLVMDMFRAEELELLVCGNPVLDFYALEHACVYEDGYTRESRTCQMLWKVIHSLTEEQKKKFLFFVTGSDRAPINGLGSLRFVISRNGSDSDRLMTAHTCFNHLLLPEYKTEKKVRDMLLLAINNSEGFGLR